MFADDTNLTATGKTVEEVERAMNGDLEYVKKWLLVNKLSLNVEKTEFLLFGSHYNIRTITAQPSIGIGHNCLKQVTHSKVLGVEVDQFLPWDKHVDSIAKKLMSGIGAIRRIREFVDRTAVHNAIVQPHFNYCSEVWDTLGEGLSKRLQKLQNRSARIITHMSNETPHQEALKALGWETHEIQRTKAKAKYMFRVVNGMALACLTYLFTRKQDVTNYSLRGSSTSRQLPLPETKSGKKSFSYDGAKVWNSIPQNLRNCKSVSSFKAEIANHIPF